MPALASPPHRFHDGGDGAAVADFSRIYRGSVGIFIGDFEKVYEFDRIFVFTSCDEL